MPPNKERSPGTLILLVLALLSGSLLVRPRQESAHNQSHDGEETVRRNVPSLDTGAAEGDFERRQRLRAPLAEFLGVTLADMTNHAQVSVLNDACAAAGAKLEFMIACAPDPVDAVLGYRFDTLLDSFQRALSTDRYVPDRYYLPWRAAGNSRRLDEGDATLHSVADDPGVLLFRRPPNKGSDWQDLLVVYLVGETSIYGIDKEQFRHSVTEIDNLRQLPLVPGSQDDGIRVLGPCFSGSAASLKLAIEGTPAEKDRFHMISGMVINLNPDHLPVRFATTTIHTECLKGRLIDYVGEIGIRAPRIAWLVESNTGLLPPKNGNVELVEFAFPMNISKVRSRYEGEKASEAAQRTRLVGEEHHIPLTFDDVAPPGEVIPQFTPDMTAVAVERTLDQLLSKIRRDRYGYVGITASDVRDKLFLVDKLSEACPDARLLLVGADLLFTHETEQVPLEGAIVASPYPLHSNNQFWSFPFQAGRQQMVFPSHSEQGVFNAAILLRHPALISPDGNPGDGDLEAAAHLIEYGAPLSVAGHYRPPVWLSIVGRNCLLPLNARPIDTRSAGDSGATPSNEDHSSADRGRPQPGIADLQRRKGYTVALALPAADEQADGPLLNLAYEAADYLCLLASAGIGILLAAFRFSGSTHWLGKFMNRADSPEIDNARNIRIGCNALALGSLWVIATYIAALSEEPLFPVVVLAAAKGGCGWWPWFLRDHLVASLPCLVTVVGGTAALCRGNPPVQIGGPPQGAAAPPVQPAAAAPVAAAAPKPPNIARTRKGAVLLFSLLLVLSLCAGYQWLEPNRDDSWLSYIFIYLEFFVAQVAACWLCAAMIFNLLQEPHRSRGVGIVATLGAAAVQTVIAGWIYVSETPWQGAAAIFDGICWFERTRHIFRGASLLMPTALVAFAIFALTMASLKRLYIYHREQVPWPGEKPAPRPAAHATEETDRLDKAAGRIDRVVSWPLHQQQRRDGWGASAAIGVAAFVYLVFLMWRTSPTAEGLVPSLFFWASLAAVMLVWAFWLRAIIVLWQAQRELHKALSELPLSPAFRRLPPGASDAIKRFFWTRSRRDWTLGLMRAWRNELRERYRAVSTSLGPTWAGLELAAENAPRSEERKDLDAAAALWPKLRAEWAQWKVRQRFPAAEASESPSGTLPAVRPPGPDARAAWIELAEDFMALYLIPYVSQYLRHWWNLVVWLMAASLMLLMALASYPFQPQELLIGTCVTMIAIVGISAVLVEVQMEWDPLLSRMMGTHPNRIDWNSEFVVGLLTWILPVGIVLFTHVFPGAWNWFGGALQNFTRTLG